MRRYVMGDTDKKSVAEAWSIQRLPFEPKGWLIELRNDLREAIHNITSQPNQVLHAIYGAAQSDSVCDVENILFYNVGGKQFSPLTTYGIRFERRFSYPEPPQMLESTNLHYHYYTMEAANEAFSYWQIRRSLAEWENVKVSRPASQLMNIWYSIKSNSLKTLYIPERIPKQFGLTITIKIPTTDKGNVSSLTKPIIDGVVSAFHAYKGNDVEVLSQRLADKLNKKTDTIADLLLRKDRAIFGERQVVRPHGSDGVKWDPADDLCLAAEIFAQPYSGKDWLISGKLYEILYKDLQ
jgi:hypothetical protein